MEETESAAQRKRSRNVSDLTEEQIQQKRRIDRKAQRAFRQRTRDRISDLQREVEELQRSSIRDSALFQQEIQSLREQNTALTNRLASIAELAIGSAPATDVDHESLQNRQGDGISNHTRFI